MLLDRRFRVLIFLIVLAGQVHAQSNSDSPYSRFGIGTMTQPGLSKSRAMGGTGIAIRDNNHINYLNPASYSAIDTMSFLFDFGVMGHYTYTEYKGGNDTYTGMNMDHLAMSFPITRWWGASVALLPYSKVGYSIKKDDDSNLDIGIMDNIYTGSGGLNQLNLGTSVLLFNHLSVGVNFKYIFGYIDLERSVQFPDKKYFGLTEVKSSTQVSDFIIDLGLQYSLDFLEKYNITLGLIFDNKTNISAKNTILKTNTFPGAPTSANDSTVIDPGFIIEEITSSGNIVIPSNFGAGLAFKYNKKISFGFDYYQQDWSKATFFYSKQSLSKSNSFHGGLEYIHNPEALRGYLNRIAYRLGGHYSNSYLKIKDEQLKDYGISFGIGLPLRNQKSSFNLAVEGGRRGTLENSLIRENYLFLSFSVTLHDFWFVKRKFD